MQYFLSLQPALPRPAIVASSAAHASQEADRCARRSRSALVGDLLPPLAPPLGAHEDAQLEVPAIGDLLGGLQVVQAVLALLVAGWMALEHGVRGEDPKLHRE